MLNDHQSTAKLWGLPLIMSGAKYESRPQMVRVLHIYKTIIYTNKLLPIIEIYLFEYFEKINSVNLGYSFVWIKTLINNHIHKKKKKKKNIYTHTFCELTLLWIIWASCKRCNATTI